MSVNVSIVTTANRICRFSLDTPEGMLALRYALQRGAHLFSGKPLIVGSAEQTEIFAANTIACIELETANAERSDELTTLFPAIGQNPALRKLAKRKLQRPLRAASTVSTFPRDSTSSSAVGTRWRCAPKASAAPRSPSA